MEAHQLPKTQAPERPQSNLVIQSRTAARVVIPSPSPIRRYIALQMETHLQDVTVPLTLVPSASDIVDPTFRSTINPEKTSQWVVFPKGWGVDQFRRGVFHPFNSSVKRFVSVLEGTVTIRVTDGEERTFKKGDIFEAVDLPPCKGRLSKSEDGAVALFTNHPS